MPPITWKNIEAPSVADASRAMYFAGQNLNAGFDTLKSALGEYQTGQDKLWKQQDSQATQGLLTQLYGADSVDKFNALQASGALDQAVAANGARIDQAAINKARDGRLGLLQTRAGEEAAYSRGLVERNEVPIQAEISKAIVAGDFVKAKDLTNNLSQASQVNTIKAIDTAQNAFTRSQQDNLQFGMGIVEKQNNLDLAPLRRRQLETSISAQQAAQDASKAARDASNESRLSQRLERINSSLLNLDDSINTANGQKQIQEFVAKLPKDQQLRMTAAIGRVSSNKEFESIPVSALLSAASSSLDTSYFQPFGGNSGDSLETRLKEAMSTPGFKESQALREQARANLLSERAVTQGRLYPEITNLPAVLKPPVATVPGAPSAGKSSVNAPTAEQIAADAAAAAANAKPLPAFLGSNVDARVVQQQAKGQAESSARNTARLEREAKLNTLREEISGLTPARINVLTPSEASKVLSKYGQVLPADLQRLLRKRT
jgi:hypothetical protein